MKDADGDGDVDLSDVGRWLDVDNDGDVETGEMIVLWPVVLWLIGHQSKKKNAGTLCLLLTTIVVIIAACSGNLPKHSGGMRVSSAFDLEPTHWSQVKVQKPGQKPAKPPSRVLFL